MKAPNESNQRKPPTATVVGLVGRCFHTFRQTENGERAIRHQGIVQARIEEGIYLVQYF